MDYKSKKIGPPELPDPPMTRVIRYGFGECSLCGSSMAKKYFWQFKKGCLQPECFNYAYHKDDDQNEK